MTPVPISVTVPDGFVADDAAVDHGRQVAFEDVQVGAADGGGIDLDDGVGVGEERRPWDLFPGFDARSVVDECFHSGLR